MSCKIHSKKYFQCLVLHVKHFPKKLSKTLSNTSKSQQKQINCNQEQISVTTSTKSCKQNKNTLCELHKIPDPEGKERRWVLREKNGGRWVSRGGSVRMRDGLVWRWVYGVPWEQGMDRQRTRTRDGSSKWDGLLKWDLSIRMTDGLAEYPLLTQLEGWVFFLSFFGCEFGKDVLHVQSAWALSQFLSSGV